MRSLSLAVRQDLAGRLLGFSGTEERLLLAGRVLAGVAVVADQLAALIHMLEWLGEETPLMI
jgi:hypothetical protein